MSYFHQGRIGKEKLAMKTSKKANKNYNPERKIATFEEFSKKWRGFLKGANIENWKDHYTSYLMEKYK